MERTASKRYSLTLLVLLGISLTALTGQWLYFEPLTGDLTRLGWYTERDFGWSQPQRWFGFHISETGDYDRYYDVVVVGDSYSISRSKYRTGASSYWHDFLGATTGLSVLVKHFEDTTAHEVIGSQTFRATPPKLLVIESVERYFIYNTVRDEGEPVVCTPERSKQRVTWRESAKHELFPVQRHTFSWDFNFRYPLEYDARNLSRALLGTQSDMVLPLKLTRSDLFSSRRSDELLVYIEDIGKANWIDQQIEAARCRMIAFQKRIESNGQTRVVFLLAPDKLTIYSEVLERKDLANLSRLDKLYDQTLSIGPRVDHALKAAIAAGEKDVYLPNDTHWGYRGHQLVADSLMTFLSAEPNAR